MNLERMTSAPTEKRLCDRGTTLGTRAWLRRWFRELAFPCVLSGLAIAGIATTLAVVAASAAADSPEQSMQESDDGAGMMQDDAGAMTGATNGADERPLTDREIQFFERSVRPILVAKCYSCHSAEAERIRGDLLLDTREGWTVGGASGPAIEPGDPERSLLIAAVRWTDEDLAMPPKRKLDDADIATLEEWVRMGAPDPRVAAVEALDAEGPALSGASWDIDVGREFWSFQPVRRPEVPVIEPSSAHATWSWTDIDRFVLAAMLEHELAPVDDAEKGTWIRRVTFDLTGLPPTPEEVDAFARDRSPAAYERVVDRLLASPAFGERWGRHWLDVARYGESSGKENNVLYPHAWRYRDYVINSLNADKPYDQFLREQIAGDLLPSSGPDDRAENLVATAYLALGPKSHNQQNAKQFVADLIDEQIDSMTQGMLGITVACARCHDHKFDPIPQSDYYAMAGILLSSSTQFGTYPTPGNRRASQLIALPEDATVINGPLMPEAIRTVLNSARGRLSSEADELMQKSQESMEGGAARDQVNTFRIAQQRAQVRTIETILERFDEAGKPTADNRVTMGMLEGQRVMEAPLLQRGEIDKPQNRVPRGFVQVISGEWAPEIPSDTSGRLELAEWVTDPANPLTARVWVNRIWLHLFGKGVVPTPDNFGHSGVAPTHPELLDWLATRLVEGGWSTKSLIREIVLSHAYRLDSVHDKGNALKDPDITWLWRMPNRRLEGEAIRDAMLSAAGTLQLEAPQGSVVNFAEGGMRGGDNRIYQQLLAYDRPVRSVYLPLVRDRVPGPLDVFDFPDPSFCVGDRDETNVATQALYLMNDPAVIEAADAMAQRVIDDTKGARSPEKARIIRAFELALGREPTGGEITAATSFLDDFRTAAAKDPGPQSGSQGGRDGGQRGRRLRDRLGGGDGERPRGARGQRPAQDVDALAWSAFCQSLFQTAEFRTLN